MAKAGGKSSGVVKTFNKKSKVRRPGVHSKKKNSNSKNASNYRKAYVGQGH